MKRIELQGIYKLDLLAEELRAAIPALSDDAIYWELGRSDTGDWMQCDDSVDEAAVRSVADAHDPSKPSEAEQIELDVKAAVVRLRAWVADGASLTTLIDARSVLLDILRVLRRIAKEVTN